MGSTTFTTFPWTTVLTLKSSCQRRDFGAEYGMRKQPKRDQECGKWRDPVRWDQKCWWLSSKNGQVVGNCVEPHLALCQKAGQDLHTSFMGELGLIDICNYQFKQSLKPPKKGNYRSGFWVKVLALTILWLTVHCQFQEMMEKICHVARKAGQFMFNK